MFGIGVAKAYGDFTVDLLGGTSAALVYALFVRVLVGIGWFFSFKKAGKNPILAFVPLLGEYHAFRMVWDDFSFAFIFATTTVIAFIDAIIMEQTNGVITACAVINFIMWWIMAILMARAFQVGIILTFLYGGVPWIGALLMGLWPRGDYKGPWSSDPEADQNLTAQERKKRRKRAAREAARKEEEEKARLKEERRNRRKDE